MVRTGLNQSMRAIMQIEERIKKIPDGIIITLSEEERQLLKASIKNLYDNYRCHGGQLHINEWHFYDLYCKL